MWSMRSIAHHDPPLRWIGDKEPRRFVAAGWYQNAALYPLDLCRQPHAEDRPPWPGLKRDLAPVLQRHDVVADIQPQAGPVARRLCREKRLEDARLCLCGDARAVILDFHQYAALCRASAQRDLAAALPDCVRRVVDQVRPHLV